MKRDTNEKKEEGKRSMSGATALKITVNIYIYMSKQICMCTHTYSCTFRDVYCSKPLTFHMGFMFSPSRVRNCRLKKKCLLRLWRGAYSHGGEPQAQYNVVKTTNHFAGNDHTNNS